MIGLKAVLQGWQTR